MDILSSIELIEESKNLNTLIKNCRTIFEEQEFCYFVIAEVKNPASLEKDYDSFSGLFPSSWQEEWTHEQYGFHDPNFLKVLTNNQPWRYEEAFINSQGRGRKILQAANDHGLKYGVVVPIHSFNDYPGCISLCSAHRMDLSLQYLGMLSLLCSHIYMKWTSLRGHSERSSFSLSDREVDVLSLTAVGFSGKLITEKLAISEETLRTHMRNIRMKTNSRTIVQAVVKALQAKAILL